ncbi:MAG: hypothetical protein OEX21_10490, partial [Betaproteobacteria bacterium]|nr:hypothetical protein [Betaproteobacteria bacterium]
MFLLTASWSTWFFPRFFFPFLKSPFLASGPNSRGRDASDGPVALLKTGRGPRAGGPRRAPDEAGGALLGAGRWIRGGMKGLRGAAGAGAGGSGAAGALDAPVALAAAGGVAGKSSSTLRRFAAAGGA